MSREKGMHFTAEMIRAIEREESPKTQTRRVIKKAPHNENIVWSRVVGPWAEFENEFNRVSREGWKWSVKLPYQASDILYIKEAYATGIEGCPTIGDYQGVTYRVDHIDPKGDGPAHPIKWRSSRFMPKALARTWIEVLEVRVERLRDITVNDTIAEGVFNPWWTVVDENYRCFFADAWDAINGKRGYSWESNPWVAVYAFRRIER